ncbi:MAG: hypothetical protein WCI18_14100 [Pseudomonadota bacterium]
MLQYEGKAFVFDRDGNPLPLDEYDVSARVADVVDNRIRFSEEKRFSNGSVIQSEFEFDLQGRHAEYPAKGISLTYVSLNECVGTMSNDGVHFSVSSHVDFSLIRNFIFNSEKTYVETLSPKVSDLSDLSHEETLIVKFVQENALTFLDVRSIILFGSRGQRSHRQEADFDFGFDAVGQKRDWLALADCLRNEAPSLCEIQVVPLSHKLKSRFVASIYKNGRFIYVKC